MLFIIAVLSLSVIRWMSDKHLCHLPIPRYVTSGLHTFKEKEYRFLVMERFGTDLDKYFKLADSRFSEATVCYLALRLVRYRTVLLTRHAVVLVVVAGGRNWL